MKTTFKLNFITNGEGIKTIDEVVGYDEFTYKVKQENNRYGRDINFLDNDLTFYKNRNHEFDLILFYWATFGWESQIQLIINIDGLEEVMGILNFKDANTDQIEFFTCSIIDDNVKSLVKKRDDIETNIFSNKTIDDDDIDPVSVKNMLLKAKPILQKSSWEMEGVFNGGTSRSELGGGAETRFINPVRVLKSFSFDDSFVPFSEKSKDKTAFEIVRLKNSGKDITVSIKDSSFEINGDSDGGGNGDITYKLIVATATIVDGKIINDSSGLVSTLVENVIYSGKISDSGSATKSGNFTFKIPFLNRNNSILVYWSIRTRKTSLLGTVESFIKIGDSTKIEISGTAIGFNMVFPAVRLIDAVKYNIKSISTADVNFPIAQINGEYYNQFIFTGKSLRNINDDFNIKFKDVEEFITEFNGDFSVNNGNVFIGTYKDFYPNEEIASYDDVQFDNYEISVNETYTLNKFTYGYNKFFSQREKEVDNTLNIIHGTASYVILNKFVEDKKEIKIKFIRDPFYIQEQASKAIEVSDNTATNIDSDIFIIDGIENAGDLVFEEASEIRHFFNTDTGRLEMNNDGSFNFTLLGISVGSPFEILPKDINQGSYTVFEVLPRTLILTKVNSGATDKTDGIRNTVFRYTVISVNIDFISRTDEGVVSIEGAEKGSSNVLFSIRRNIEKYWLEFLSTANRFTGKKIKNTEYISGKDVRINAFGLDMIESSSIDAVVPILSGFVHKVVFIKEFSEFLELKNKLQTTQGYITYLDNNGHPQRIYPRELSYKLTEKELSITGEEKYTPSNITINSGNSGFVIVNELMITDKIKYKRNKNLFSIFDTSGKLLFKPAFWNKIDVNNAVATTPEELESWLKLIS